jgi:hypothetical protein
MDKCIESYNNSEYCFCNWPRSGGPTYPLHTHTHTHTFPPPPPHTHTHTHLSPHQHLRPLPLYCYFNHSPWPLHRHKHTPLSEHLSKGVRTCCGTCLSILSCMSPPSNIVYCALHHDVMGCNTIWYHITLIHCNKIRQKLVHHPLYNIWNINENKQTWS